jgi:hypothetical protein
VNGTGTAERDGRGKGTAALGERLRAAAAAVPAAYRAAAAAALGAAVCCAVVIVSVHRAEARVTALMTGVAERNEERLALMEAGLKEAAEMAEGRVAAAVERSGQETREAVLGTRRQVSALDATYGGLLEAQYRRIGPRPIWWTQR